MPALQQFFRPPTAIRLGIVLIVGVLAVSDCKSFDGRVVTRRPPAKVDWPSIIERLPLLDELEEQFEYQWRVRVGSYDICRHDGPGRSECLRAHQAGHSLAPSPLATATRSIPAANCRIYTEPAIMP